MKVFVGDDRAMIFSYWSDQFESLVKGTYHGVQLDFLGPPVCVSYGLNFFFGRQMLEVVDGRLTTWS